MNEILTHDMKFLGLICPNADDETDPLFGSYFESLPDHFVKCLEFGNLYRLKKRKQKDVKENLEIFSGLDILIHDPQVNKYFYRVLQPYTNMNKMLKYFKDGNLYILKEELRPKEEPETEQVTEEKDEEEDALIF
jgi:hypothetical protein